MIGHLAPALAAEAIGHLIATLRRSRVRAEAPAPRVVMSG